MSVATVDPTLAQRLAEAAGLWRRETRFSSSPRAIVGHPAYKEVIAMGPAAVPDSTRHQRDRSREVAVLSGGWQRLAIERHRRGRSQEVAVLPPVRRRRAECVYNGPLP